MQRIAAFFVLSLLAVSSAFAQKQIAVEHSYAGFSSVQAGSFFEISFIPSDEYRVRIVTDSMIENYILAYAKEGTLYLDVDEKAMPSDVRRIFKAKNPVLAIPHVEIYSPAPRSVSITGNSVIDCDSVLVADSFSLALSKTAAVKKLDVRAGKVMLDLDNRSQAYMSVEAESLNVQSSHNTRAELRIDVRNLAVYADGFASVELFGNAVKMTVSTEGSSKISLEGHDRD